MAAGLVAVALAVPFLAFAQTTDVQSQIQSLLSQIKALQEQLKALVASSSASGGFDWMASSTPGMMPPGQMGKGACVALNRNLRMGSQGDDVKGLQQMLKDDGDFQGGITGFFGQLTAHAMAAFQMHMGIASSTDGSVGPMTRGFFERKCGKGIGGGMSGGGIMGGRVSGTIAASSASSITIQNKDNKSVLVNITASTTIQVFNGTSTPPTAGTISDLVVGKMAAADGPQNQDGSIQAVHISVGILPPPPMMGGDDGNHGMMPPPWSASTTPPGGHCGGFIQNAPMCSPGYHCQLGNTPDMGGTCVANGSGDGNGTSTHSADH